MSLLWLVPVLAGVGVVVWLYRTREAPVPGRGVLLGLRVAALAILALLLVNPALPGGLRGPPPVTWVLLDRSLSMAADDGAPWREARARARALLDSLEGSGEVRLLLFDDGTASLPADSLGTVSPDGGGTRLAPALERAAESGAAEIRVLSDLRAADPVAVEAVLAEVPARVRLEGVEGRLRNAAVATLELPAGVAAGERPTATVRIRGIRGIRGEGGSVDDSVTVEIREEGRLVASRRAALPDAGREVSLEVRLPAPRATGSRDEVRYEARVALEGDAFAPDDARLALVTVDPPEGGALFLSLRPDWEPRFLLPVLRRVTGLELAGYLRVGEDRWIALAPEDPGGPGGGGRGLDGAGVRRLLSRSTFLVLHGVGRTTPDWVAEAAGRSPRLLLLPDDPTGAALGGVRVGRPLPGEWEPVAELPASPLAPELAGVELDGLPPLGGVLPLAGGDEGDEGRVPLRLALRGRGPEEAALVVSRGEGRRRAVTLASGFWRWAFRDGTPREAYRRLWAGVASWLLSDDRVASGPGVRPGERVAGTGAPVAWSAPGLVGRRVRLELRSREEPPGGSAEGERAADTTLVVPPVGTFWTPALPPGSYEYRAVAAEGGGEVGAGRLEVEAYSAELLRPLLDTARIATLARGGAGSRAPAASRRPLRTHPLPYLLVLALLSAEWIGRRRRGLR